MGSLFGSAPKVAPAPVMPTVDNSQAKLDAAAAAQQQAALRGRTSTMLTGGQGVAEGDSKTSKALLGQ